MSEFNLFVIDTETTLNGNHDIGLAHPMHPLNEIVVAGFYYKGFYDDSLSDSNILLCPTTSLDVDFVVGHNLSFDLLYLYKRPDWKQWLQKQRLWDTQLAEYILTGQEHRWASLDQLSVKYGLPFKDDKIKKYFEAGIGSDKIPKEELQPYLYQDVMNTQAIAQTQIQEAIKRNILPLMISQMEALHATTEMMFNGLNIDLESFTNYSMECNLKFTEIKEELEKYQSTELHPVQDIDSASQWSRYYFGGTVKKKKQEPVGMYKNGKVKYKTVEYEEPIKGVCSFEPDPEWVSIKTGKVSVDIDVLKNIAENDHSSTTKLITEKLIEYRDIQKQLSTYITGLGKHVIGYGIHGKLNHVATITGRLSSSSPNLQNISNNPIKKIFKSRFGPDGVLVEVDFNQLEVVALAHITGDPQLIRDISTGTDIHSELFRSMYGHTPTKEERKPFKSRTFALIYGAGAKTIAQQSKCSLEDATKFMDTFYARYPLVRHWHSLMAAKADKDGVHKTTAGLVDKYRTYQFHTETGRMFIFKEYYNDKAFSSRQYSYSPTELKNYPVQGFATGDIVPMMLGIIFRKFKDRDGVLLINTIHDSILFDCTSEAVEEGIVKEIVDVLNNTHKYFETTFGHPLALKLSAGASVGNNWYEMEELTKE